MKVKIPATYEGASNHTIGSQFRSLEHHMMTGNVERANQLISRFDWSLLKGSAVITIGMIIARGVGFIVSFLQARFFDPADFGTIQYAVSLAGILAIGMQPLGQHVVARYIGMVKNDPKDLKKIMSNIWLIVAVVFGLSIVLGILVLLFTGKFNPGVLVIFFGTSIFFTYWGLARGHLASGRLAAADISNNVVQVLLLLVLIGALGIKSTLLAMLIQGLSALIPLALLQAFWPLAITFERQLISRGVISEIFKFSLPIWISHASYILYTSVALLFLEHYKDSATVGIFSLAGTLSILFSFIPTGFATFLMPKIAGTSGQRHNRLLFNALSVAMLANLAMLAIYYAIAPWLVEKLFGPEYLAVPELFILMAIVTILTGANGIVTSVFVGSGRAQDETKSRLVTAFVTIVGCWLLIPSAGVLGAAWAMLLGICCGLGVYGLIYLRDYIRRKGGPVLGD